MSEALSNTPSRTPRRRPVRRLRPRFPEPIRTLLILLVVLFHADRLILAFTPFALASTVALGVLALITFVVMLVRQTLPMLPRSPSESMAILAFFAAMWLLTFGAQQFSWGGRAVGVLCILALTVATFWWAEVCHRRRLGAERS